MNGFDQVKRMLEFMDSSVGNFPREVSLKRIPVKDEYELYEYWEKNKNVGEVYMSVYSYPQIYSMNFHYFFVDFDFGDEVQDMLEKLQQISECMEKKFSGETIVVFSGMKGYHVYLAPRYVREKIGGDWKERNFKVFARRYIFTVFDKLSGYIDKHTVGDYRRMARMVGAERRRGICKIVLDKQYFGDDGWVEKLFEEVNVWGETYVKNMVRHVELGELVYPRCIVRLVEELVNTGELDHYGRFVLTAYLSNVGWEIDEIVDLFRVANDFSETYTRYQVTYICSRGLKPFNCRNMILYGFCNGICQKYPNMLLEVGK